MCYTILDIVMKKFHLSHSVLVLLTMTLFFSSCPEKKESCDCCQTFQSVEKKLIDSAGNTITIKIPTAFTPTNIPFCDSITYDKNGVPDYSKCRKNTDSIYNDKLNNAFRIIGLENFRGNSLIIKTPGDTTPLAKFTNYQLPPKPGLKGDDFVGTTVDSTLFGHQRERILKSGRYQYILQIYDSTNVKYHNKSTRIDSITGFFCIIRDKAFCNIGCEGKDVGDPLIK